MQLQCVGKRAAKHFRVALCYKPKPIQLLLLVLEISQVLCCLHQEPRLLRWHRLMPLNFSAVEMAWFNGLQFVVVWSAEGGFLFCYWFCYFTGTSRGQKPLFQPFWSTVLFCGAGLAEGQGLPSPLGNTRDV